MLKLSEILFHKLYSTSKKISPNELSGQFLKLYIVAQWLLHEHKGLIFTMLTPPFWDCFCNSDHGENLPYL